MKLPHHDHVQQTVPDAMHTVKDVVETVVDLVVGRCNTKKIASAEVAYEKVQKRAQTLRQKFLVPTRAQWVPLGWELSEGERELLCGPTNTVAYKKKVVIKEVVTGRNVEYRASKESLNSNVIVRLNATSTNPDSNLGSIHTLFQHSFAEEVHTFAVVMKYTKVYRDPDSQLLYTHHKEPQEKEIVHLDSISKPLLIVVDNDKLWILN